MKKHYYARMNKPVKQTTSLEEVDEQPLELVHLFEDAVHEVQEINYGSWNRPIFLYFCVSCKKFVDGKIYVKKD